MRRLIYLMFLVVAVSNSVYAEWASYDDAAVKTLSYSEDIKINSNGTYEAIVEHQIEILKESGRVAANYRLFYNGDSEKIEVLAAETIYGGKKHLVDKGSIEDKPLASAPYGFDQKRQILLAFPRAEVGAKICLKYKLIVTKIPLDNFFSDLFYFGNEKYVVNAKLKIQSQLPLHILVNNPENALKIVRGKEFKKDRNGEFYNLDVTLTKPIFKGVINEPRTSVINNKYLTWVSVSTMDKWENLAAELGKSYAQIFSQSLPKDFSNIVNIAAKSKDELEQINVVTSLLNDKVKYMGDWRSIRGRFVPRDLAEIGKTQLGDCKDFAAVTAVILAKLGYKTQVAVVRRGIGEFYPEGLPDLGVFNHAIVKVTNKQGKVYWIDPTNFQSMADGVFPDIANKKSLVLDQNNPSYEKIFSIDPERAQSVLRRQIVILPNGNSVSEVGKVTLKGEAALGITGTALKYSEKAIKNSMYYYLSGVNLKEENKKMMKTPDLKSRVVKDISFDYSFEQNGRVLKTNAGPAIKLKYDYLDVFFAMSQDCVADLLVSDDGIPTTSKRQTIIKNVVARNVAALNKEIKTPWLYIKRDANFNGGHDLQINDTLIVYKNLIAGEDFKKPEFIKMKKDLEENFKEIVVVFDDGSKVKTA